MSGAGARRPVVIPADNHVHSQWSWDAVSTGSMERTCERAVALGVPSVAFTEHLDFSAWAEGDPGYGTRATLARSGRQPLDVDGYQQCLQRCRERFPDLRILSGVEVGEPHLFTASLAAIRRAAPFDRVLGSLHCLEQDGTVDYAERLFATLPAGEVMRRYFVELLRMIERSDAFAVLAHADYPRRYWPATAGRYDEAAFEEQYRAAFRALAGTDRVLEINTSSPLWSRQVVRWWYEEGGTAVSFGSDAHRPSRLAERFTRAVHIAEAAGFRPGRDRFDFWRRARSITFPGGSSVETHDVAPTVVFAGGTFPAAKETLHEFLPEARIDVADVGNGDGLAGEVLVPLMTPIDGPVMDRVQGLRMIHQWGAGLEGVDVEAATARGIAVGNVPSVVSGNAESVAEWCVMAALVLSRRLPDLQHTIRQGTAWGGPLGQALSGRTAGIVGLGGIGQALATRLRPFGTQVIGVTRRPDPARAAQIGVDWLGGLGDLPSLLRRSDYVFLCLPLTPDTAHILNERTIARMAPGAYLINPGRGGLVDEAALLAALAEDRLAGAALDVFASEPLPPSSPLLKDRRILATPHIAGVTDVNYHATARYLADVVSRLAQQRPLDRCVNWDAVASSFYAR